MPEPMHRSLPLGVGEPHQPADVPPGGSLARLRCLADDRGELVGAVLVALDQEAGATAAGVAEREQELDQDRRRVGLGMRVDRPHQLASRAVERRLAQRARRWRKAGFGGGNRVPLSPLRPSAAFRTQHRLAIERRKHLFAALLAGGNAHRLSPLGAE